MEAHVALGAAKNGVLLTDHTPSLGMTHEAMANGRGSSGGHRLGIRLPLTGTGLASVAG